MGLFVKNTLKIIQNTFIVFVVFISIIGIFSYFIQKDKPKITLNPVLETRKDIYSRIREKEKNTTFEGRVQTKTYRTLVCVFLGEACTNNPSDGDKNFNKSVLGVASSIIVYPFTNPPASGTYWITTSLEKTGFIPKSYAAEGIGFASIKPIMGIWIVFRDVAYMLLVLFLIIVGFMIMFRMKINPQTVISVENTLPKIAITLILITFSFAIAGFMIDLMYVLIALFVSVLGNVKDIQTFNVKEMQNAFLSAGPGNIYDGLMGNIINRWQIPLSLNILNPNFVGTVSGIFPAINIILNVILRPLYVIMLFGWQFRGVLGGGLAAILDLIVALVLTWFAPGIANLLSFKDVKEGLNGIAGATFSIGNLPGMIAAMSAQPFFYIAVFLVGFFLVPPFIIGLLFIFTIFYVWARIFMLLFTAYLQTILLIIFSPFLIALELIPGSKFTFSQWLKNLAGELVAFPVVVVIFTLSYLIGGIGHWSGNPLHTNPDLFSPPFMAKFDANTFGTLISFGLSFLIPDFIKSMKEAIGAKGLGVSAGVGLFFGGTEAGMGGIMGGVGTFSSIKMAAPGLVTSLITKIAGKNAGAINEMLSPSGTPPQKGTHP